MPTPIWDRLFKPLIAGQRWIAAEPVRPAVREKAGMHWTPGDELLLRAFGKVNQNWRFCADEIQFTRARWPPTGERRGRTRHGALVQAPGFMAPPRDRRGCRCTTSTRSHRFTRSALGPRELMDAPARWSIPHARWPACGGTS